MELAVLLSVAASFCTATSSVCQRLGARAVPTAGFDPLLVFRLARQPVWLLGFASMLAGFVLQVTALRFGPLALVQPILAAELLFVFGYLAVLAAVRHGRRVQLRDLLAALGMSGGISLFLRAAAPSGGRPHAPGSLWWLAGLVTGSCVLLLVAVSTRRSKESAPAGGAAGQDPAAPPAGPRPEVQRAAVLGVATGIAWGFVAAVIKELSSHIGRGLGTVFTNWAVYVLIVTGAAALILVSHALAAGPLAASQPGFTIGDPATATLLGLFLFGESLQTTAAALAGEVIGLIVLLAGVAALSHSRLITGEGQAGPTEKADGPVRSAGGLAAPGK